MVLTRSEQLPVKHPGQVFKERILDVHHISVTDAAKKLCISRKNLSLFVNGKADVSVRLAKKLEVGTGISAGFWLNLQKSHHLYVTRNEMVEAEPLFQHPNQAAVQA